MYKILFRLGLIASAATMVAAIGSPAHAKPAQPALNDVTTPVSTHVSTGRVQPLSNAQYQAARASAGDPLSATERVALAAATCWTWSTSEWRDNVYGGTLVRINGTINWCQDGSTVWGGSYSWTTYTNFGWYFDSWSNPQTGYYNPSHTRYDTVAQAKFCITWCAGKTYLGMDLWGNANATYGSSDL